MRPLTFSTFVIPLLLGATTAWAGNGTALIVAPPSTTGMADSDSLLVSNAADALEGADIGVAREEDARVAGFDWAETAECIRSEGACEDLFARAPAEWILYLHRRPLTSEGEHSYEVIAQLFNASSGDLLQVERRVCGRCSSAERMAIVVRELVTDVARSELAHKGANTYVTVQTVPSDALVSVDGIVVGTGGRSYRVAPGSHRVQVHREGFQPMDQEVHLDLNETKAIRVELARASLGSSARWRRPLGWGALGVGALGIASGITFIALDGTSTGNSRDTVRDTQGVGIGLSVVGGLMVLGGGAVLLFGEAGAPMEVALAPFHSHQSNGLAIGGRF